MKRPKKPRDVFAFCSKNDIEKFSEKRKGVAGLTLLLYKLKKFGEVNR